MFPRHCARLKRICTWRSGRQSVRYQIDSYNLGGSQGRRGSQQDDDEYYCYLCNDHSTEHRMNILTQLYATHNYGEKFQSA